MFSEHLHAGLAHRGVAAACCPCPCVSTSAAALTHSNHACAQDIDGPPDYQGDAELSAAEVTMEQHLLLRNYWSNELNQVSL